MNVPTNKTLRRLLEDALDDLGCDVNYDALPKEEVLDDIASRIEKEYSDVIESAHKYEDLKS